jgi:hypothetical protein
MKEFFAIIGQRLSNLAEYKMLATGFFIDSNGNFLTAGHVFREHENSVNQFLICFPEGDELVEVFPIIDHAYLSKTLYLDDARNQTLPRPRMEYQCGPEYIDVAIGKVDLENTPFFKCKRKRPAENEKLKMPCYNIKTAEGQTRIFRLEINLLNSGFIEFNNRDLVIKERLRRARIPYLYDGMRFENIDTYNNCIEVYGDGIRGNSGAPILDSNKKVIGMYISGTNFNYLKAAHLARYIYKRAQHLMRNLAS